jgi:6-phosphogluconolactonase/glucosamine-6-phosphate isomerase/deaminase
MHQYNTSSLQTGSFNKSTISLYKPKVIQFESLDILYKNCLEYLTDKTLEASGEYGTTRLILGNSSSLEDVYKLMSRSYGFVFDEMEVYQLDENLKTQNNQSNLVKSLGKDNIESLRSFNPIKILDTKEETINNYIEILDQFDDEGADICVLEIDNKGCIAGLVAKGEGLDGNSADVVVNGDKISMSINIILKSQHIICIMKDDAEIIDEILTGSIPATEFPVKMLLAHPSVTIFYYLDI